MDTIAINITEAQEIINVAIVEAPEVVLINVNEVLGKDGADGAAGAIGGVYVHIQAVPANPWNINHALGYYPSVTIVDSSGSNVIGDIQYIDINNITVTFSGAFSGKAFLS